MYCRNCGNEVGEGQKFCGKCGCRLIAKTSFLQKFIKIAKQILTACCNWLIRIKAFFIAKRKYLVGFLALFVLLIASVTLFLIHKNDSQNLYRIYYDNYVSFINTKGKEVLTFTTDNYDFVGQFREGRLFVAKKIKELNSREKYVYGIVKLSIVNKDGDVLKNIDKYAVSVIDDTETPASYLPEFYKGYAVLHIIDSVDLNKNVINYEDLKIRDIYINRNGQEVVNVPKDIKEVLSNVCLTATRYQTDSDLTYEQMPCSDNSGETCIGFVDENKKIHIEPIYDAMYLYSGDWYGRNPSFFNGIALVFIKDKTPTYIGNYEILSGGHRFIDKKGNFINTETYDYAQPFYGDLAFVQTDSCYGYINKKGEWVWQKYYSSSDNEPDDYDDDYDNTQNKLAEAETILNSIRNTDYSRENLKSVYNSSLEFCYSQNFKYKGEFAECQENYIKQKSEQLYKVYSKMYDYCNTLPEVSMAEKDSCIASLIE